jgi:hypothetical protein
MVAHLNLKSLKIYLIITFFMIANFTGFIMSVNPQGGENHSIEHSTLSYSNDFPNVGVSVFVEVEPENASLNEFVTVTVWVFNLTPEEVPDPDWPFYKIVLGHLWLLSLNFTWDPSILEYVSHTVTIPIENFTDGVLHEPVVELSNKVNPTAGFYELSYTPSLPADPFNNENATNKIFNMTFKVVGEGQTFLRLPIDYLILGNPDGRLIGRDMYGAPIYLYAKDGFFRTTGVPIADFSFWPEDAGVVNKPVIFNASASEDPGGEIVSYEWDFGDDTTDIVTTPIIEHSYSQAGKFIVSLKVTDNDVPPKSGTIQKEVTIVENRSIKVKSVSVLPEKRTKAIQVNFTVDIDVWLINDGKAEENVTLTSYYNNTPIDPTGKISAADWTKIATEYVSLFPGPLPVSRTIYWDTTGISVLNASYYVLVNATGVPYDQNVTDSTNIIATTPVYITNVPISDAIITKLEFGFLKGEIFERPAIEREPVTISITVLNDGTFNDTFGVTLYLDGVVPEKGTWTTDLLAPGETQELIWQGPFEAGNYNITALVIVKEGIDINPANNLRQGRLRIIKPPKLEISFTPTSPLVDDVIILNASGSVHQEPEANITKYMWEIYQPLAIPGTESPLYKFEGVSVNFTASVPGTWTIILKVRDSFKIEYDPRRAAGTSYYRKQRGITVATREIPIHYIAAAVISVTAVIAGIALYRRRKS